MRQHFYETVEQKATSRQVSAVPHQVLYAFVGPITVLCVVIAGETGFGTVVQDLPFPCRPLSVSA